MNRQATWLVLLSATLMLLLLGCDPSARNVDVPSYLDGVENATSLTNGFHVKYNYVGISTSSVGGNKALHLTLGDKAIRPYAADIFLEEDDLDKVDLKSGKYEVIFLKNILVINDPVRHHRMHFKVANQELAEVEQSVPEDYLRGTGFHAIGIAIYGDHKANRLAAGGEYNLKDECAASGGTGATQCSNACCSITCSSGYYATCGQSCNCTKAP